MAKTVQSQRRAMVSRRAGVRAAGAAVVTGALLGHDASAPPAQAQPAAGISGAWLFVVSIMGLPEGVPDTYRSHLTFVPGGGLVQMAWSQRPLALVSTGPWFGYGAWEPVGECDVALPVVYPRFDETGTLIGSGKGRGVITLSTGGLNAAGRFRVDLMDTTGAVMLSGEGTVEASRITVEPLP